MIDNVGNVFYTFLRISTHISLGLILLVVQRQTLGEMGSWMVI